MKKTFLKVVALAAALLLTLPIAACRSGDGGDGGGDKGKINIVVDEAGFGSLWLENLAKAYTKKTGVKVGVSKNYIRGETMSMLEDGTLAYDIAMPMGIAIKAQNTNKLVDLTSVYDTVPEGSDKPIKEMMMPSKYEGLVTSDGKIYQIQWADVYMSIIYNKTSLDKAYPGGYTLPRTTDELFEFCDDIKSNTNLYPFSFSPQIPYSYATHLVWWAQYEGLDVYYDYYKGYYRDANGERVLASNGEVMDMPGRSKSLEIASDLLKRTNGYMHAEAANMSYIEMQAAFLGHGYKGRDMKECAFIINGNWLENEMAQYLEIKPQDFRMMKMPIISDIVEKLENSAMTDLQLRQLIDAIDEGAEYADIEDTLTFVSENDFNRVKQARQMLHGQTYNYPAVIPVTSRNKELAKQFLVYMVSPEGQEVYAKALKGAVMPYGHTPSASIVSPFIKSGHDLFQNNYISVSSDDFSPLVYNQGFTYYIGLLDNRLYIGDTPSAILKTTKDYYMSYWNLIIALAD